MMVNICVKLYLIPASNEGDMDRTSCFIKFDVDLGSSQTVFSHCTPSHDGEHLCQVNNIYYTPVTKGVTDQTNCFITLDLEV